MRVKILSYLVGFVSASVLWIGMAVATYLISDVKTNQKIDMEPTTEQRQTRDRMVRQKLGKIEEDGAPKVGMSERY